MSPPWGFEAFLHVSPLPLAATSCGCSTLLSYSLVKTLSLQHVWQALPCQCVPQQAVSCTMHSLKYVGLIN